MTPGGPRQQNSETLAGPGEHSDGSFDVHTAYVHFGMSEIEFEWDARKASFNRRKHGVSFEEAASAFYDEGGLLLDDPDHSEDEERFILLGLSSQIRVLVVVHAYRGADSLIRIISARRATPSERDFYQSRLSP